MLFRTITISFVISLLVLEIICIQKLYTFIPEHCEMKYANKSLVDVHYVKCIKKSRLELYLNITYTLKFNVYTDEDAQVKIIGYQFRSNEYRRGPIDFQLGFCSAIESTSFDLQNMIAAGNLHKCPALKDTLYYTYNITPRAANMPPFIPEGRWMLQLKYFYQNKYLIGVFEWYATVEYPIRIK